MSRKRVFLILTPAILGVIYMALCMVNMRQSIWFDEAYSSYLTRFDVGQIWNLTAADVHPPLYYFILKCWAHMFGHADFAMRTLSAVLGAVAILFAFLWLKYKYGLKAAMLGGLLLSISPAFVRYGQEMRMYTMVAAIVFASTYFLQLAVDNGRKIWWIIYAILVAAGMWTHYFAAFAFCAHLIYLFKLYGKSFWKKHIWVPYLLAVALYLPWIPSLFLQAVTVEKSGFWIPSIGADTIANYFGETMFYLKAEEIRNWLLVLALIIFLATSYFAVRYHKRMKMLLSLAILPLVILTILSLPPLSPMFISRYVLYAMMALPMIAGVGLVMLTNDLAAKAARRKKVHLMQRPAIAGFCIMTVLIGGSVVGLYAVYAKGNYNMSTDTKSASKDLFDTVLEMDNGKNLPIISNSEWLYYDMAAYTSEEHPVLFIDELVDYRYGSLEPLKQSYFGKIEHLDEWLEKHDSFWYVGSAPEEPHVNFIEFPRDGWRVAEVSNAKFNEHSDTYQILKLERDQSYNSD